MKKILIGFILLLSLSSCARSCQSLEKSTFDNHSHNIRVSLYSGGKIVKIWEFNGIINNSESSDGYYFYVNGKLTEVAGDVVIEYLD